MLVQSLLSSAFDMITHRTLLDGLDAEYGEHGPALHGIESYLDGPSYTARIGPPTSLSIKPTLNASQGSVLHPILFMIYLQTIIGIGGRLQRHHIMISDHLMILCVS